eukprot:6391105-Prymnesium_polylepis.3
MNFLRASKVRGEMPSTERMAGCRSSGSRSTYVLKVRDAASEACTRPSAGFHMVWWLLCCQTRHFVADDPTRTHAFRCHVRAALAL